MIDLHSHILPGLDDGARTLADSLEMARAALADGTRIVAATPHVRFDYPTTPERMERALAELREALHDASVALDVVAGGEIALGRLAELDRDDLRRFVLGGSSSFLLLEFPYTSWPFRIEDRLHELRSAGFRTILAHPERNPEVQARPERLEALVAAGTLVQVTAASLDGRLGRTTRGTAAALVDSGLAHLIASDAHAPGVRSIGLSAAVAAVGDDALARWLTHDVPESILRDEPVPPRPPSPELGRRRRRSFLRRGG